MITEKRFKLDVCIHSDSYEFVEIMLNKLVADITDKIFFGEESDIVEFDPAKDAPTEVERAAVKAELEKAGISSFSTIAHWSYKD